MHKRPVGGRGKAAGGDGVGVGTGVGVGVGVGVGTGVAGVAVVGVVTAAAAFARSTPQMDRPNMTPPAMSAKNARNKSPYKTLRGGYGGILVVTPIFF